MVFDIVITMTLTLLLWVFCFMLEMLIYVRPFWKYRQLYSMFLIAILLLVNLYTIVAFSYLWGLALLFFSIYRVINLLRIWVGRVQYHHLFHTTRNTSMWVFGFQLFVLSLAWLSDQLVLDVNIFAALIIIIELAAAVVVFVTAVKNIKQIENKEQAQVLDHGNMPSITVAIPARNETQDLEECLISILSSNYPKLEILVLDDCSQDKNTPQIIKSFAHEGVRFLAGEAPPEHWLAKNFAYEQLSNAASGEIILFCGVDARFTESSISNLAGTFVESQNDMLSVIPINVMPKNFSLLSLLLQPSRYAWEIAVPRRFFERPPALSTCWMMKRTALNDAGGFDAVRQAVSPERYFSRYSALSGGGYSFVAADNYIDVNCTKSISEQKSTAMRTRYPQLHKRPEFVSVVSLAELVFLFAPLIFTFYMLIVQNWTFVILAFAATVLQSSVYSKMVNLTFRKNIYLGTLLLPVASVYDVAILNYSMLKYEFGSVYWKGRDVTGPVMHLFVVRD